MAWAVVVNTLLILLMLHVALKLFAIVNAIRWISRNGERYRRRFQKTKPRTDAEKIDLFGATGGSFLPFGAKDFRVRERYRIDGGETRFQLGVKIALRVWSQVLFTAPSLAIVTALILMAGELAPAAVPIWNWTAMAAAALLVVLTLALYAEAISWYFVVRSYARSFFALGFHRTTFSPVGENLAELRTYIYLTVSALLTNSLLGSVAGIRLNAFVHTSGKPLGQGIEPMMASILHTASSMSFLGDSPLKPDNGLGYFLTALDLCQGVVFVLFGIALLPGILAKLR